MKYKLIQIYPGYEELGTIAEFYGSSSSPCFKIIKPGSSTFTTEYLSNIKNYPKFWELVVEKDYEILSLRSLDIIEDLENNETINMLLKQGCSIHSVKRLSDGEIFTIGDKIDLNNSEFEPNFDNLLKIKIFNNKIRFKMNFQKKHNWDSSYTLNFIKKFKQPLFTTEQVKEIENIIKNYIK